MIGEWKRVNIEVQGNIESAQGTLKLDTSKFKILPGNKIEITNDKQPVIILPDGTEFTKNTTEFEYRVIAKSYLLLTNAEGEISTFKRMEEYPASENKNKSFTGTWRFIKYTDMKSGETITAADLNSTSHYLEFTPFSEKTDISGMSQKKTGENEYNPITECFNYSFIMSDVFISQGELINRDILTDDILFLGHTLKEIPWQSSPWNKVKRQGMPLGKHYRIRGERYYTLQLSYSTD